MQCIVLMGGIGSRMKHISGNIPKALIPLHGRPFLSYLLDHLFKQGVESLILSVGYRADLIKQYIDTNTCPITDIHIVDEGTELRGTAGALREVYSKNILNEQFFVTYGDSYLPIDFRAVVENYHRSGLPALMTIYKNTGKLDKSNVIYENEKLKLYDKFYQHQPIEKFDHIDYGLVVLNKRVIEQFIPEAGKYDLANVFTDLSIQGLLAAHIVQERFYEIGSPEGLQDFEEYLNN